MNEVYGWVRYFPEVVEKYGYIRALIYGEELSQLNLTGTISKNKIAEHLKISRRTVAYHTKVDVEDPENKQFYQVSYEVINDFRYIPAIVYSIIEASYNYSKGIVQVCYISQDKLAKIAGLSRSTIQSALKKLEAGGIIFYLEDARYKETRKIGIRGMQEKTIGYATDKHNYSKNRERLEN